MTERNIKPWISVILLGAVYACSQLDRLIMGIFLDPIKKDLGVSDAAMGFLIGPAFAIFYSCFAIPVASFADRGYRRNIISISVILWSFMTAACGFALNYTQMAFCRMLVAVGESGSTPASVSIISSLFPQERRATAIGVFAAGGSVGVLLAFASGGLLMDMFGWRHAFFIIGLPGIILGYLVFRFVPEPPINIPENVADRISFKEALALMVRIPAMRHLLAGYTLSAFVGYGLILWTPSFLSRTHGVTGSQLGLTLALLVGVGGGIVTLLSGRIVDAMAKRDEIWRTRIIAVLKIASLPLLIGFLLVDDYRLAIALYAIPAALGSFYLAPTAALIQQLIDDRMRAMAAAIGFFLSNIIGLGLGPQSVGILSDMLQPTVGQDSLRFALACLVCINLWAAYHFWRAGRLMRERSAPTAPSRNSGVANGSF